jgi:heme-degrading monooxygenase HmoA
LIVRILKGRVQPGQVAVFREQALQVLHDVRQRDGLVHAQLGRQVHSDGAEEVIFVSVWVSLEDLYRWVGSTDLLDTPVQNGGRPNIFDHFEVQHYETYVSVDSESIEVAESSVAAEILKAGV